MERDAVRATEALIHDYSKLVFHIIHGLIGNFQESEDLTQETFLQAFRGIEAARSASGSQFQAKAWLLRIAINTVYMHRRRRRGLRCFSFTELQNAERREDIPAVICEEIQDAGDLEALIAERDAVQHALAQLPETLRLPLLLSIIAGFSSGEIARILELKEAAVRQRLTRARQAFQRNYAQESGENVVVETSVPLSGTIQSRPRGQYVQPSMACVSVR